MLARQGDLKEVALIIGGQGVQVGWVLGSVVVEFQGVRAAVADLAEPQVQRKQVIASGIVGDHGWMESRRHQSITDRRPPKKFEPLLRAFT